MSTILKGGTLVTETDAFQADLVMDRGTIAAVGRNFQPRKGTEVVDARGMYVMPGGIDAHVHFQLPFCGTVSSDDFLNGTKAAACGGVTTVIDYAIQTKGRPVMEAVEKRRAEADGRVCVDYALHAGITDWKDGSPRDLRRLVAYGIPTVKMFMIYRKEGWMADDYMLFSALEETARCGAMIELHAESVSLLDGLVARYHRNWKRLGARGHALSRPAFAEEEAVRRAIMWAGATGGRVYIVHMSAGASADAVREAQERGVRVYAETCPQYLLLDDSVFRKRNGHLYATCPQIKSKADAERLWRGVTNGEVSLIATDTCTFTTRQKAMWGGDFTKIPYGMPGVETMVPLMHTFGVGAGRFSVNRLVQLVSANPARLHGLYPQKGTLAVGADADVVVFDPRRKHVISPRRLQTNCDWSPYDGWRLTGWPALVFSRGRLAARNGKFVGEEGWGRFVRREPWGGIEGRIQQ
ncbi:MAG: dihydropyrimidinase [bacterium]|nr:dihydropyrimidinase [bacterium]